MALQTNRADPHEVASEALQVATGALQVAKDGLQLADPALQLPPKPRTHAEIVDVGRKLLALKLASKGSFLRLFDQADAPYSYRSAANWMKAATEAGATAATGEALAAWTPPEAPEGMPPLSAAGRANLAAWLHGRGHHVAADPAAALPYVVTQVPLMRFSDLVAGLDVEIKRREDVLRQLSAARSELAALPQGGLPAISGAGRDAIYGAINAHEFVDHAAHVVADGDAARAAHWSAVVGVWLECAHEMVATFLGPQKADAGDRVKMATNLRSLGMALTWPRVPANAPDAEAIIADIRQEAKDGIWQREMERRHDMWTDARIEAGMAIHDDLKPEDQAALDRHLAGLSDDCVGLLDFWPDLKAVPEAHQCECRECGHLFEAWRTRTES